MFCEQRAWQERRVHKDQVIIHHNLYHAVSLECCHGERGLTKGLAAGKSGHIYTWLIYIWWRGKEPRYKLVTAVALGVDENLC